MASGDAKRILPLVAKGFADLGYRRATTAALAKRAGVRENVLYRLWPSKKEMFMAAIGHIWEDAAETWRELLAKSGKSGVAAAQEILEYESRHHGEAGLHKVIFAGLTEAHDPDIARALRKMYRGFHEFIAEQVGAVRQQAGGARGEEGLSDGLTAWGLLGISMMSNVDSELKLFGAEERRLLFTQLAKRLILPGKEAKNRGSG